MDDCSISENRSIENLTSWAVSGSPLWKVMPSWILKVQVLVAASNVHSSATPGIRFPFSSHRSRESYHIQPQRDSRFIGSVDSVPPPKSAAANLIVPYGSSGGGGGGGSSSVGGGGGGGSSSAGQPIATKLRANNTANGINNSFFFTYFSSLTKASTNCIRSCYVNSHIS